jgi:hypothetical protein
MLAFAMILGTADHLYESELEASLKSVEEGIDVAKQHTLGMYGVFGPLWSIPALVARDPSSTTLKALSGLIETLLHYRCYLQAPLYQILLVTEFGRLGQVEKALALARAAEALMQQTGERWFEPEIYRVLALLSAQAPESAPHETRQLFTRALRSAIELKTLGWELRVAISFARFLQTQNRRKEAREILFEARCEFSQDRTSADLAQADALLENLLDRVQALP